MKVLITGGSGLLGQYLNLSISGSHEILTLFNKNKGNCGQFNSFKADLTDYKALKNIFSEFKPDVVIHTAAVSRPEMCDEIPMRDVMLMNAEIPGNIAGLCSDAGACFIFTSTDLVYDGDSGGMMPEDGYINPASRYAESKVIGEGKVMARGNRNIILRTALLYGFGIEHTSNNFHIAYGKFSRGEQAALFHDQYRTPLALHEAARLIAQLVIEFPESGIYNFGGCERISRAELGKRLCRIAGFDESLVKEISMKEVQTVHKVADVSMNIEKLNSIGLHRKTVDESIAEMFLSTEIIKGT